MRESGRLARRAAGNQKVDSRFDLPRYQIAQRSFIQRSILLEGGDQRRSTASEFHDLYKIARKSESVKRGGGVSGRSVR